MIIEQLIAYCLSKPHAKEDYPFGPEPTVIKVASKIFALISVKEGKPLISLKCDPFVTQSLKEQYASIKSANLLNEDNWITVIIDGSIFGDEIYWMIDHSYELVLKSLTKDERESIG